MKYQLLALTFLACLIGPSTALAQAEKKDSPANPPARIEAAPSRPATNAPPARRNFTPPVVSPEVHADRTVTFRLRAPNAKEVSVSGQWGGGNKALTKDEQGLWSVTVGPIEPELYEYAFVVDGLRLLDPGNPQLKPMRSPTTSILEIPGQPPLLSEFVPSVAHGTVHLHEYHSKAVGGLRRLRVYTPPGYDKNPASRFPVLYLFHGAGDNEGTWTVHGRAHLILDNLQAQGKARPMIIVMTDGHAAVAQPASGGANPMNRNLEVFQNDLLGDVIPLVESNYRVQADAAGRAIAGLSMGGGQSLTIGLNHPELFAWVGGFSSYVPNAEASLASLLDDPAGANRKFKLIWIACGKDDFLIANSRKMGELLKSKGVQSEFLETEGNHSWPVWRKYIAQFAPLLFVEKK